MTTENGKLVLYVELLKALHATLHAALLFLAQPNMSTGPMAI